MHTQKVAKTLAIHEVPKGQLAMLTCRPSTMRPAGSSSADSPGSLHQVEFERHRSRLVPAGTSRNGFTLLEVLVVLVILGLLAAYVAPRYFSQIGKGEATVARSQIEAFEKALDQFRLDVGRYPTTEEGLNALVNRPAGAGKWSGPYLKKAVPNDPWGRPYVYRAPGAKGDFDLQSLGKDGAPGGTGDNADVTNQ